jgi:putative transposase
MFGSPNSSLEAAPFGKTPRFLIQDYDSKFGPLFSRVASSSGVKVLKTPYHAPKANACCERFLGSVRRECLDHLLILHEQQLRRVLQAYVAYFNQARPHQGLRQQIPDPPAAPLPAEARDGPILALPILGGLHHVYRRAA